MSLGGGVSKTNDPEKLGREWFPQESLSIDDFYKAIHSNTDVIISHDAPYECGAGEETVLKDDYENNRKLVSEIVNRTNARTIIHGHYGMSYEYTLSNGSLVRGVGFLPENNTVIVDHLGKVIM